ncbi:hypothetical protein KQX54_021743 [Cotesia glomerata]|uniref:Uncharacterized protein n=1 Tax=Cotesia glomerata TaxID=32391 RepID=A0AAV7JAD5_COTGL|nr:hypothetical protein KQX54_021743 [Cotesia glomerata]
MPAGSRMPLAQALRRDYTASVLSWGSSQLNSEKAKGQRKHPPLDLRTSENSVWGVGCRAGCHQPGYRIQATGQKTGDRTADYYRDQRLEAREKRPFGFTRIPCTVTFSLAPCPSGVSCWRPRLPRRALDLCRSRDGCLFALARAYDTLAISLAQLAAPLLPRPPHGTRSDLYTSNISRNGSGSRAEGG